MIDVTPTRFLEFPYGGDGYLPTISCIYPIANNLAVHSCVDDEGRLRVGARTVFASLIAPLSQEANAVSLFATEMGDLLDGAETIQLDWTWNDSNNVLNDESDVHHIADYASDPDGFHTFTHVFSTPCAGQVWITGTFSLPSGTISANPTSSVFLNFDTANPPAAL